MCNMVGFMKSEEYKLLDLIGTELKGLLSELCMKVAIRSATILPIIIFLS